MTAKVHLALVLHQHQPLGNYGFVFDELYNKAYNPLLSALEAHPGVKAGIHTSGPLLDWLMANRHDYIDRLQGLVDRGQVEVLGGAYYEPILPAVSEADRLGQLAKMREALREIHGREPTGAWLAERVWETELPRSIAGAGYRWTIVDDVHRGRPARGRPPRLVLTEFDGTPIGVFGSSTKLRYLIPWGTVDECMAFLTRHGDRFPGSLLVMGDDSEKFGGWPTTYKHCWEDGWVDAFLTRLEREAGWVETVHLGDWHANHDPVSLAYLPSTSYMEMGEWSLLPADQHDLAAARAIIRQANREDLVRFLRGGHWRNFFVRYPEVNYLHKRLLQLSADAHREGNRAALDEIWQAECNCPFWHGVFGGVYLEHIRHANFGHLVAADAALLPGPRPADIRDWDMDGRDEVCLRAQRHAIVVDPELGGWIQHWDLRERGWHLTHAVARRPEAYHDSLTTGTSDGLHSIHEAVHAKDPRVLQHLGAYDRGPRLAAQETILHGHADRDAYCASRLADLPRVHGWSNTDTTLDLDCEAASARYHKRIALGDTLAVTCDTPLGATLFTDWNLSLPQGADGENPAFSFDQGRCTINAGPLSLECAHNARDAWVERLYSVSNTEGGVELAPQGWCVVFAAYGEDAEPRQLSVEWSLAS
jgi:alpha-amylase